MPFELWNAKLFLFKCSEQYFVSQYIGSSSFICGRGIGSREGIHDPDWNIIHIWEQHKLVNLFLESPNDNFDGFVHCAGEESVVLSQLDVTIVGHDPKSQLRSFFEAVPEAVRGWRGDVEDYYTSQTHYLQVQSHFLRGLLLPPLTVAHLHNESVTKRMMATTGNTHCMFIKYS